MRRVPLLSVFLAGVLCPMIFCSPALARDPAGPIDASRRNPNFSQDKMVPSPELRPIEHDQTLQEKRFDTGELRDRPRDPIADRRASIEMRETHEKKMASPPEHLERKVLSYDKDLYQGRRAERFQTKGHKYRTSVVEKYQRELAAAEQAGPKTIVKKRTSFDEANRFIFRRNRPKGDKLVSKAGGDANEKP